LRRKKSKGVNVLEFVTLNTSSREQNHHRFKKADDEPQKNINQAALPQIENKQKLTYSLAKDIQIRTRNFSGNNEVLNKI
jgi:hypothetical protein